MQGMSVFLKYSLFFLNGEDWRLFPLLKRYVVAFFCCFFWCGQADAALLSICTKDLDNANLAEFVEDFLALELTLLPGIDVIDCGQKNPSPRFLLRQRIEKKEGRLIVRMELLNLHQEKVWEKVDFIQNQSRQSMVARAKFFAQEIGLAILENRQNHKLGPNLEGLEASINDEKDPKDAHKNQVKVVEKNPRETKNALLLSVGLSTKTHFASKGLFEEHRDRVASKPYFITGVGFTRQMGRFSLMSSVFGALSSTELRRPLPSPEMGPLHIKNLDILLSGSHRIVDLASLKGGVGIDIGYYFFESALSREKKLERLNRYFSFREGFSLFLIQHFDLFASNLVIRASYFPFLQNSNAQKDLFKNYAWQFSFGVESSLYRAFMLVLNVAHSGESFLNTAHEKRIVRYQNLAYMGLLARI